MSLAIGDKPLTAKSVVEGYEAAGSDALILPPSIVEDLAKLDGGVEKLKQLSYVGCGGGKKPFCQYVMGPADAPV